VVARQNPPRDGEGDRPPEPKAEADGGGAPPRRARRPGVLAQPIKAVKRARKLRREMSLAEVLLWIELQKRPGGHKFRKQVPQHPLTLDFACLKARLVIEVDGEAHNRGDQPKWDEVRDRVMAERGFRTLRLPAYEVLKNMEGVIQQIVATCGEVDPLHRRPQAGGPPPRSGEDLA
jgi:very-short-patch-repair endonuclease